MPSPKSVRFPPDLEEATDSRWKKLGYRSFGDYVRALARYDLMVGGPHHVTLPVSHKRPDELDRLDAFLLFLSQQGGSVRGQLFEAILNNEERDPDALTPEEFVSKLFALVEKFSEKPG